MTTFADGENGLSVRTKINDVLQHMDGTAGTLVVNEAGADVDFRVESDTEINALFVDGATGFVGLGTGTPQHSLLVTALSAFTAILKISDRATQSSGALVFGDNGSSNASVGLWRGAANSFTTAGNTLNIQGDSIQFMGGGLFGAGPERMRIDSVGNVGIGAGAITAIFGKTLQVGDGSGNSSISLLGTGAGSFGDAYLASFSNVVSLVARASTTLVFGTNDAEAMRISTAGNVGIGTTNPTAKLDIFNGNMNIRAPNYTTTARIGFGNPARNDDAAFIQYVGGGDFTGYISIGTNASASNVAATEKVWITAPGNIGLGSATSNWYSAGTSRVIEFARGAVSSESYASNDIIQVSSNSYKETASVWKYPRAGEATLYEGGRGGKHVWYNAPTGIAGANITFTQAMTLDGSGSLGIGTATPQDKLQVVGGGVAAQALQANGTPSTYAIGGGLILSYASGTGSLRAFSNASGTGNSIINFLTTGTERMRIDDTGRVLIGTTTASGANLLQVNSDARINGLTVGLGAGSVGGNTVVGATALRDNTTGDGITAIGNNALRGNTTGKDNTAYGLNSLLLNTTGGQNTATGMSALRDNIAGSGNTSVGYAALISSTGSSNVAIGQSAGFNLTTGSNNTIIGSVAGTAGLADTIILGAGTTERMRIDSSGNMGLGVTPSAWSGLGTNGAIQTPSAAIVSSPGGGGNTTTLVTGSFYNGTNWIYRASAAVARYDQWGSEHRWFNAPSGTSGGTVTFTQAMTLSTLGNLGIGTTSPNAKLDVADITPTIRVNATAGGVPSLSLFSSGVYDWTLRGGTSLRFFLDSAELARFDAAGNLGIGTISPNAAAILDVQSTTKGVRFPNMTTTQKNAIANVAGNVIFDTTLGKLCVNTGSGWQTITSA